jgi:hypothetical protein
MAKQVKTPIAAVVTELVRTEGENGATIIQPASTPEAPKTEAAFDFAASGASIARSDSQRARLIAELGEALQGLTFVGWGMARAAFIAGAIGTGYKAPEDLYERTIKAGQSMGFIGDKPKAASTDATKKAEQRTKAATLIEEAKKLGTPAELRTKAAAELGKGAKADTDAAERLLKAAKLIETTAASDAKAASAEKVKMARDRIRAAIERANKLDDSLPVLVKMAAALEKISPAPKTSTIAAPF